MKECSEDDNIDDYHTKLTDGYSQSKWVAEQLISRAGQKGLPVVIYRLGKFQKFYLVNAHLTTGILI